MQNTYPYLNPKFHLEETVDQSCLVVHRFGELKTKTCELIVEMTVTSKFTQQDGRKKRTTNQFTSDKRDRVITCVFCRDLHLTLMFFGLL